MIRHVPAEQLASLTKILKCAKDTDELTLKANDDADTLGLVFQNGSECRGFFSCLFFFLFYEEGGLGWWVGLGSDHLGFRSPGLALPRLGVRSIV